MSNERIDIELTDKISPSIAQKITAIAEAARKTQSTVDSLKASLDTLDIGALDRLATASAKVTNAQARQDVATARLTASTQQNELTTAKVAIAQQRLAAETAKAEIANSRASAAASKAATAATQQEAALSRLAIAQTREIAATDQLIQKQTAVNRIRQVGNRSQAQSLYQTQNLVYQLNDVVVGLASGQKPLTVLIQQGSQISTIYGPGKGVLGTLKLLAGSLATIFLPLLPAIAVVAALAGGFAVLTNEIRKSTGVQVGFGDTFKAVFQVAGSAIYEFLLPAVTAIGPASTQAYDIFVESSKKAINFVVGLIVTQFRVVGDIVAGIPFLLRDAWAIAVNFILTAIEKVANGTFTAINNLINATNELTHKFSDNAPLIPNVGSIIDLTEFKQTVEGTSAIVADQVRKDLTSAFNTDYAGQAFKAISKKAVYNSGEEQRKKDAKDAAKREKEALEAIQGPYKDYIATLRTVDSLKAKGLITQQQYLTALRDTRLVKDLGEVDSNLPQFAQGKEMADLQATADQRLAIVQNAMQARILTEEQGNERIRAINQETARQMQELEMARHVSAINSAESTFASLSDIAKGFAGEQSDLYKVMFGVSKAFAIADSLIKIQQGIANAFALPYPANLAAVATVAAGAASIVSNIQSVQLAAGKKDGGYITGPGGPRSDSIPTMLSNGEFVINADATRRNRPLLEAINSGRPVSGATTPTANGAGLTVTIQNYGTSKQFDVESVSRDEVRIIARDEAKQAVQKHAPGVIAADMNNPNGTTSKAISRNTTASRRRV